MTCPDVTPHLTGYVCETLDEPLRDEVRRHLETCVACSTEAEDVRAIWAALGHLPAPPADVAGMQARFETLLEGYADGVAAGLGPRRRLAWWWTPAVQPVWVTTGVAAALVVGVMLGRGIGADDARVSPELTALRAEVGDLREMVSLSLLQQQSASERLKGVAFAAGLAQSDGAVVSALLDRLGNDPNVNVRLAAVDALRRFAEREPVRQAAVEALGQQTSPLVQMALIDFVVEARLRDARETLTRLADDASVHEMVRARAQRGLREVAS